MTTPQGRHPRSDGTVWFHPGIGGTDSRDAAELARRLDAVRHG